MIEQDILHTCKSCGHEFRGNYCNVCGEKVLVAEDRSFKTWLTNFNITSAVVENKFIKTLFLIIRKPGFFSKEYSTGKRVNYMRPMQLFFVLNVIYFLFPLVQLFNTSLNTQMHLRTHSPIVRSMVNDKLAEEGYSYQGYSLMYNEKSTSLAKLLVILFVLCAAGPLAIIFAKRSRYFSDHLTVSLELAIFNLAMNTLFLSLLLIIINNVIHWSHTGWEKYLDDTTLTLIFVLTNAYFMFSAGKTFYNERGFLLIIKVMLGLLGLFVALELYRIILFLVTFWLL